MSKIICTVKAKHGGFLTLVEHKQGLTVLVGKYTQEELNKVDKEIVGVPLSVCKNYFPKVKISEYWSHMPAPLKSRQSVSE